MGAGRVLGVLQGWTEGKLADLATMIIGEADNENQGHEQNPKRG